MIVAEAIINIYSMWQSSHGANNIPSLYLLIVLEITLGGYFILQSISKKAFKIIIASLIFISVANTIYVSLINGNILTHNPLNRSLQGYFMVVFSLLYYYDLLKNKSIIRLTDDPTFWIITAIFFYFGTTQFLFLFIDFIYAYNPTIPKSLWKLHYFPSNVFYLLLAIGLWKKK